MPEVLHMFACFIVSIVICGALWSVTQSYFGLGTDDASVLVENGIAALSIVAIPVIGLGLFFATRRVVGRFVRRPAVTSVSR